ncbi:MAG TPA: hypothetical protein VE953_20350 [Terriglobales bacterium]|nr:hypothetical protein [Terriglobales bacterium]
MSFGGAPDEVLTLPTPSEASDDETFAANEPLLGYRAWLIQHRRGGYELRGVLSSATWASAPGAWTGAVCLPHAWSWSPPVQHERTSLPHPLCTCGLYAYHSLSIGGYDGRLVQPDGADIGIVWGAVLGAGRILVYEEGWRAQFARPVALVQGSGSERHVRGLSDRLRIAIAPSWDIGRRAAESGYRRRALAGRPSR